jgi:hypothetical protein
MTMAMKQAFCAYCGEYKLTEKEHVVPQSLAPVEMWDRCQWVLVPACSKCNRRFSADESDFRGFAVLLNAPGETLVKDAMFQGPVSRNWQRPEGRVALQRTLAMIRKPDGSGLSRLDELLTVGNLGIVANESLLRVVRKIIRGLYFHHFTATRGLPQVLPESQVCVGQIYDWSADDINTLYQLPTLRVIHPAVFVYTFIERDDAGLALPGIDSVWLLYAAKGAIFGGIVRSNTYPFIGNQ